VFTGEIDQETALLWMSNFWQTLSKEEVENQFDHKNLNLDVSELKI
jgi:6-pyruvoyltetrahydropterin/6-carboxytetrahydropterin synthase